MCVEKREREGAKNNTSGLAVWGQKIFTHFCFLDVSGARGAPSTGPGGITGQQRDGKVPEFSSSKDQQRNKPQTSNVNVSLAICPIRRKLQKRLKWGRGDNKISMRKTGNSVIFLLLLFALLCA